MIISKVTFTEEEISELKYAQSSVDIELIRAEARQRYIDSLGDNVKITYEQIFSSSPSVLKLSDSDQKIVKQAILTDVKEIINALTKEDIDQAIKERDLKIWKDTAKTSGMSIDEKQLRTPSRKNGGAVLLDILSDQISAYDYYEVDFDEFIEIIEQKITEWYGKDDEDWTIKSNFDDKSKKLPIIKKSKSPEKYYLSTFKPVDILFNNFPIGQTKKIRAESEKDRKKGKTADILLLLNFDELKGVKISRELTVYDQHVWNACANLIKCGYSTITPTHIYKFMGYKKKLNARDREKILESVKTISRARVFINNKEENELYKKYPLISLDAPLLSATICTARSGNNEVVDAIEISEIPKLFTIAEQRGQVTTIPFAVVEIPVISKTDDNLQLLFYLIKRIVYMKHDSTTSKKILFNSVYDKCNIEEYKQKQRLPEKLERIFDYYKSIGWVSSYRITNKEIQIEIPSKK